MKSYLLALVLATAVFSSPNLAHAVVWEENQISGPPYPTVDIIPFKLEEDHRVKIKFFTPAEREDIKVKIVDGIFYDRNDKILPDSATLNSKLRVAYVMDAQGDFYIFDEFANKKLKHSSPFAGGPVAGGGEIAFKDGRVILINTNSGHYPTKKVYKNVLSRLQSLNVVIPEDPEK